MMLMTMIMLKKLHLTVCLLVVFNVPDGSEYLWRFVVQLPWST